MQLMKLLAMALLVSAGHAEASNWVRAAEKVVQSIQDQSSSVQHSGTIEFAFSPNAGAEKLILKVIDSARSEIRMMAYSFTSASVTRALIDARRRGVDVAIIADHKSNAGEGRSGKSRSALSTLVSAGCRVRTISAYAIHHDKVIIADRETVETGSFNYSQAAATKNSENVLVVWRNPGLAKGYLAHWNNRFAQGQDFNPGY